MSPEEEGRIRRDEEGSASSPVREQESQRQDQRNDYYALPKDGGKL